MRNNTYIRWETIYKKMKGYIGTRKLLEEGFSNRQIAVLKEEGYLEKICHGFYWINGSGYDKPIALVIRRLLFVWVVHSIIKEQSRKNPNACQ